MSEEKSYAEIVSLTEPENQPSTRLSQYSVVTKAMEHLALLKRFESLKKEMVNSGVEFGGRVLMIGPAGTDFEAFSHYLCREVPLKMVRFKMEEILKDVKRESGLLSIGFEFARRNSPVLILIDKIESVAPRNSERSPALQDELKHTTWDAHEVVVVATTSQPQDLDTETLASFDRTYVFETPTLDDRIRAFEQVLKNRDDIDPTAVAELTEKWGFSDVKHLASSLFMLEEYDTGQISREKMEELIDESNVTPITNSRFLTSIVQRISGLGQPKLDSLHHEYPDDFLDQLYLLAVSEDYANTQRIIEVLNEGLPLLKADQDFLTKYPYLLNGTPEDRLTRLLRAKKNCDRLQRIMGH